MGCEVCVWWHEKSRMGTLRQVKRNSLLGFWIFGRFRDMERSYDDILFFLSIYMILRQRTGIYTPAYKFEAHHLIVYNLALI